MTGLNFLRRASQIYTLRQHRARSISVTDSELVEVGPAPARPAEPSGLAASCTGPPASPPPAPRPPSAQETAGSAADAPGRHAGPALFAHLAHPHHAVEPAFVTDAQLVEIRASQRTFEGAYIRTALGLFSFSLIVLKIFTAEFYSVGALFAAYGASVLVIALYRRHQGNRQYFEIVGDDGLQRKRFRTSGNVVLTLTALSVCAYTALLALVVRLL